MKQRYLARRTRDIASADRFGEEKRQKPAPDTRMLNGTGIHRRDTGGPVYPGNHIALRGTGTYGHQFRYVRRFPGKLGIGMGVFSHGDVLIRTIVRAQLVTVCRALRGIRADLFDKESGAPVVERLDEDRQLPPGRLDPFLRYLIAAGVAAAAGITGQDHEIVVARVDLPVIFPCRPLAAVGREERAIVVVACRFVRQRLNVNGVSQAVEQVPRVLDVGAHPYVAWAALLYRQQRPACAAERSHASRSLEINAPLMVPAVALLLITLINTE